jgi:DNA-binding transcriptional ArsR family regulator
VDRVAARFGVSWPTVMRHRRTLRRRGYLTTDQKVAADFTLRFAMLHMIEETARHCGYLDLLGEATDDAVGM